MTARGGGVEKNAHCGAKQTWRRPNLPYTAHLVNRVGAAPGSARFTAEALEQHGLTIAMWRVLVALSDRGAQGGARSISPA